jgi:hypothetical protein
VLVSALRSRNRKQHIKLAFLRSYFLVQPVQVVEIGSVPLDGSHVAADFGNGLIQLRLPAARNEDVDPSLTKRLAVASPIPLLPPVMTAIFPPVQAFAISSHFCGRILLAAHLQRV